MRFWTVVLGIVLPLLPACTRQPSTAAPSIQESDAEAVAAFINYMKAKKTHTFSDGTLRITVQDAESKSLFGVELFGRKKKDDEFKRLSRATGAEVRVPPGSGQVYLYFLEFVNEDSMSGPTGEIPNRRLHFPLSEFLPDYTGKK